MIDDTASLPVLPFRRCGEGGEQVSVIDTLVNVYNEHPKKVLFERAVRVFNQFTHQERELMEP